MKIDTKAVLERIKLVTDAKNETEIAKALGIKQQSVAFARNRGKIPPSWIQKIAEEHSVSADWLWFGVGDRELLGGGNYFTENRADPFSGGPLLPEKIAIKIINKLYELLEELILRFENDLKADDVSIPLEMKAKFIGLIFFNSITKGNKIDEFQYKSMLSFAIKASTFSKVDD